MVAAIDPSGSEHAATRRGRFAVAVGRFTPVERICAVLVLGWILLMIFGPAIAPFPPEMPDPGARLLPPGFPHLFGTDENGMDVLSRIVAAPRVDILVGLIAAIASVLIGVPIGVLIGIFEGTGNRVASAVGTTTLRLLDVLQAFPVFILAMVLVAVSGPSTRNIIIAIAFVNTPVFLRLARAEMISLRERSYADAARSIGNSETRLAFVHLLPNGFAPLFSQVSVTVGFAILLTAGLSFVGAGIAAPTPELGSMIATGARSMILGQWWPSFFPGIALGLIIFSFSVFGEALGRVLAPGSVATPPATTTRPARAVPPTAKVARSERQEPTTLAARDLWAVTALGEIKKPLLAGVTLDVRPGETVGVIGGPGSGKSILVRALLNLPPEDVHLSGVVEFQGKNLLELTPSGLRQIRSRAIGHILPGARAHLNPVVSVGEFMTTVIRTHRRVSRREAISIASAALSQVGLTDPSKRLASFPHQLSGGMAQRVCIALAMIHNPSLIVADEPTFGLDVTVQRQVLDLMAALSRARGFAQVLSTRDLGIVAQYCQRVYVLNDGRVVEHGLVSEVLTAPREEYTRRLIELARLADVARHPVASPQEERP